MAVPAESFHNRTCPPDVTPQFVGLSSRSAKITLNGAHPCQGLWWTAEKTPNPEVAFIFCHYFADFSEHYMKGPLCHRGYGVLGWNTRFRGLEDRFILEDAIDDIAAGMKWLREVAAVKKIIAVGNSGGGSLIAAYIALTKEDPSVVAPDGFIFLNSHPGRPDVYTGWLDPSVTDENDPASVDPSLDMYNPVNGPPYSAEFINRYQNAQVKRNHRITDWALAEKKRLAAVGIPDRAFVIHRSMANLRFMDAAIDPSDRPVPGCYLGPDPAAINRQPSFLGRCNTLSTWLSMWSLKESKCRLELHAAKIDMPTLLIIARADLGVWLSHAKDMFKMLTVKDKEMAELPGGHFFEEKPEYLEKAANVMDAWAKKRFV